MTHVPSPIHPACALCAGACCEHITVPLTGNPGAVWLRYHGEPMDGNRVELACRCRMLVDGKCSVYAHRPPNCEADPVGGAMCREQCRRHRENWREIYKLMEKGSNP